MNYYNSPMSIMDSILDNFKFMTDVFSNIEVKLGNKGNMLLDDMIEDCVTKLTTNPKYSYVRKEQDI